MKPEDEHLQKISTMSRMVKEERNIYFYLLVPLLIYTLKAIILMRGGSMYGHVAIPPPYDDVSYFVDAMERVQIFFAQGFYGFIESLFNNPPHSPYSTIAAAVAFLFAGPHLAGPYIMNAVMAAFLSALLFKLFRLGASTTWCVCIVLITTPWFDNLVTMFHPDLLSGFGAAIMAAILIWQSEIIQHRTHALLVGTAGGFILLIKPVAFSMVIVVWVLAFLIGAALAYREEKSIRNGGMRLLFGVLPMLVIAAPYLAHEFLHIFDHIFRGFVLERGSWAGRLAPSEHSLFYFHSTWTTFEYWFFVAIGGALGIVIVATCRGDGKTAWRFAGLILLSLVAYLVPASLEVKHYFYGGVVYGSIAVCLILVIHFLIDGLVSFWSFDRLGRFQLTESNMQSFGLVASVLIGLLAMTGLADKQLRYPAPIVSALRAEYDGVYRLLREALEAKEGVPANGAPTPLVYFPCPAPVAPDAYRFHGLLDDIDIRLKISPHQSNLQELVDRANPATAVVVPDDESLKSIYPYPVNKIIPTFRTWLEQSTDFKHIGTVHTVLGGTDVFAKVPVAAGATPGSQAH